MKKTLALLTASAVLFFANVGFSQDNTALTNLNLLSKISLEKIATQSDASPASAGGNAASKNSDEGDNAAAPQQDQQPSADDNSNHSDEDAD